ncbi:hypothetical protein Btru_060567 [Bulinus truncatus]|nr:hypothetical protein Btru_060567 [Bulinus truncatus]
MNYYPVIVAILLAFLLAEPCNTALFRAVTELYCPPADFVDCERNMPVNEFQQLMVLLSRELNKLILCDTYTDGGGWIVILRRLEKTTKFNQNWFLYKHGFGPVCSDFWIGLRHLHHLTSQARYELKIEMYYRGAEYYAHFDNFSIGNAASKYVLRVVNYTGNATDHLSYSNNTPFSTPDRDNDDNPTSSCGLTYNTGWWFKDCHEGLLTGDFDRFRLSRHGVTWNLLTGTNDNLYAVEMKIRKIDDDDK